MPQPISDPYRTLGVSPGAPDAEVRAAYRRLVQIHHPDHNHGSAESARRFEEVQAAYARVRELRAAGGARPASAPPRSARARPTSAPPRSARARSTSPPPRTAADPNLDFRLADMERELREAHAASERARRQAQEAVAQSTGRASDEELGYVTTDDSFTQILSDAGSQLAERLAQVGERISQASDQAKEHPVTKRVAELIDELETLTSKLTDDSKRSRE